MIYSHRVEQAIRASAILHKDQVRPGSLPLPYCIHPFAVALIAADYSDSEDVFVAALLHDTLALTDYTEDEMREDFGESVVKIVRSVSENSNAVDQSGDAERKKAYREQLKQAPEAALVVVAADRIHTMRTVVEQYWNDYRRYLRESEGSLEERALMYQDISNILNNRLANGIVSEFNHVYTEYKNFLLDVKKSQDKEKNQ